MASTALPHFAPAQQPGLSTFIVCDRVPEGCAAYPVLDNRHAPLVRAGEWVIVDPTDKEAVEGELFVIRWNGRPNRPDVVECAIVPGWSERAGEPVWNVGARHRGHNAAALGFGRIGQLVGDMGWRSPQLAEKFVGKVVGLLDQRFVEPQRLLAA